MGAPTPLEASRFGTVPGAKGHYESFYVTATAPEGGRAVWVRHTILKRRGAPPRPTLWLTLFARGRAPVAVRVTLDEPPVADAWLRSGDTAHVGPEGTSGAVEGATWNLHLHDAEAALTYLPARRLYDTALPSTKAVALHPHARISGTVEAGGERWELDRWDAMVGHNWGAEHAEHWIWMHAALPGGDWFDLALARTRLGPVLAPWLGGGGLSLDGQRTRLGGPRGRPKVDIHDGGVDLDVPAGKERLIVRGRWHDVSTVHWDYASPSGAARDVRNCSISDLELEIGDRRLGVQDACALEVGAPAGQ